MELLSESEHADPQRERLGSSLNSLCPTCQAIFIFAIGYPKHLWNPEHWFRQRTWHQSFQHIFGSLVHEACRLCTCIAKNVAAQSEHIDEMQDLEHEGVTITGLRSGAKTELVVEWWEPSMKAREVGFEIEETLGKFCGQQ
jgi:hypothetical protein